jgi:ParB-like chromosome segregation protein Spo0J
MRKDGEKMEQLKIEYIELSKLKPYERNARRHTEVDLRTIKNSIEAFGMCDPIGIWSDQNIVVEGHGRLMALKEMGHTEAPCIRLDHLSDDERKAYALAHNKTAEMSQWDFETLNSELEELGELDIDMGDFGFIEVSDVDLENFFEDPEPKEKEPKKIQCPHCEEWFEV